MTNLNDAAAALYPSMRPISTSDDWRIDLKYLPVGYHGRSFLALVNPDGLTANELHGLREAKDADAGAGLPARLAVSHDKIENGSLPRFDAKKDGVRHIATIASGPENEMARLWSLGRQAGEAINRRALSHDPDNIANTGSGSELVHGGNTTAYTLAKAMGLDVFVTIKAAGLGQKFPGYDRDLLAPGQGRDSAKQTLESSEKVDDPNDPFNLFPRRPFRSTHSSPYSGVYRPDQDGSTGDLLTPVDIKENNRQGLGREADVREDVRKLFPDANPRQTNPRICPRWPRLYGLRHSVQ